MLENDDINFKLVKNSKAFKSKGRKKRVNKGGELEDDDEDEDIEYVLGKSSMVANSRKVTP